MPLNLSLTLILLFILGTFFGSFLSVVISRIHKGKKGIILGKSECPKCHKKIRVRDIDVSHIKRFPFSYIDVHKYKEHPEHALLIYIDAHGKCRGKGNIDFVSIEK